MSFIHISFTRKAEIPDFQPAEQASQQEQAEYAANPFDPSTTGVAMPGSPQFEQYLQGNANNAAQGIGAGVPDAVFAGVESVDVGLTGDTMRGLQQSYNDGIVHVSPAIASDGRAQEGIGYNDDFLNASYE